MIAKYAGVITDFVKHKVSAEEFETRYLKLFKHDDDQVPGPEFDVLDRLFADVDDYVADPELRRAVRGIDEEELRTRAKAAYHRLYPGSR